jgi:hypothetical protein
MFQSKKIKTVIIGLISVTSIIVISVNMSYTVDLKSELETLQELNNNFNNSLSKLKGGLRHNSESNHFFSSYGKSLDLAISFNGYGRGIYKDFKSLKEQKDKFIQQIQRTIFSSNLFKDNKNKKLERFYYRLISENLFSSQEVTELIINQLKETEFLSVCNIENPLWKSSQKELEEKADTDEINQDNTTDCVLFTDSSMNIQRMINQESKEFTRQIHKTFSLLTEINPH